MEVIYNVVCEMKTDKNEKEIEEILTQKLLRVILMSENNTSKALKG